MMRALVVAALAVAVASAATEFDLQYPTPFIVTDAATPKACFESTKTSIPFTYGVALASGDDTETPATPAKSCGDADGQVSDLFADRVWAVKRNGNVESGECLDLWSGAAQKPAAWTSTQQNYLATIVTSLRSGQTDDLLNLPYRLIITRQLWACKYDSNVDNTVSGGEDSEADTKVALRREEWRVWHMDFDSATLTNLISPIKAGATTANAWKVPAVGPEGNGGLFTPFAGGNADCKARSDETCRPGSTTNCNNADKIESYACASSAQLLARAGQTSYSPANSFKTFPGLSKDMFGDAVDGKSGLIADLWASVSVKIATFKGTRIGTSKPADIVSGLDLDIVSNTQYKVVLSNFQQSDGFYAGDTSFNAKVGVVPFRPAVFGSTGSIQPTQGGFDPATSAVILDDNDLVAFSTAIPQTHYWANLQTDFSLLANWTCKSIGTTVATPSASEVTDSTQAGTYGRFRYNCDKTYNQATNTPGVQYNDNDADYPALQRLYLGFNKEEPFMPLNFPISVTALKADPVYIGFLRSLSNPADSYRVNDPLDGVDGEVSSIYETYNRIWQGRVQINGKQSDGWFMTGVATVLISVFFPLSWCLGSAILGKSGGSAGGGKSLDVNFSGTKNQA